MANFYRLSVAILLLYSDPHPTFENKKKNLHYPIGWCNGVSAQTLRVGNLKRKKLGRKTINVAMEHRVEGNLVITS